MRVAAILLLFLAGLAALPPPAARAKDPAYLEALIAEARGQRLAEDRQWLTLGHYERHVLGIRLRSVVDSPGFILAESGKTDPAAELEATLAHFFAPPAKKDAQHPQCAFIARYHWLKEKLRFDPARLPEHACPRFEEWIAAIDPVQVTLIFPSAYLNQPSSMFGHTLLRIDRKGQSRRARLNSYAINYGAFTGRDTGMVFALKGLVGLYPGNYSVMPYYKKVKDYSDLENRDIWEYELNLDAAEIRRLLMHVWEMGQQYANYYFFDENCSYQLLALLQVARPSLRLTGGFNWWAIPADTVRRVVAQQGILRRTVYRPSARAVIDHRLKHLDGKRRALAYRLAVGERSSDDPEVAAMPPGERAALLELAYDYLQFRYRADKEERDPFANRSMALLRARSQLAQKADLPPVPTPKTRPDQGHESARLAVGGGYMDGRFFAEARLRPAYHDILDPQGGFVAGTEINFLDIAVRYYDDEDYPNLESATLVGIRSITPRNRFFKPLSWRLEVGAERFRRSGAAAGDLAGVASGGVGLSYRPWDKVIVSGFADLRLTGTPDLPDSVLVDIGPAVSLLYQPTGRWGLNLSAGYGFALDGDTGDALDVRLEQSFALNRSLALRVNAAIRGDAADPFPEVGAALHWYF